jgi:hypothetical protein
MPITEGGITCHTVDDLKEMVRQADDLGYDLTFKSMATSEDEPATLKMTEHDRVAQSANKPLVKEARTECPTFTQIFSRK